MNFELQQHRDPRRRVRITYSNMSILDIDWPNERMARESADRLKATGQYFAVELLPVRDRLRAGAFDHAEQFA